MLLQLMPLCFNNVCAGFSPDYSPDQWFVEMSGIPFGIHAEQLSSPNLWRGMVFAEGARPAPALWKAWDSLGQCTRFCPRLVWTGVALRCFLVADSVYLLGEVCMVCVIRFNWLYFYRPGARWHGASWLVGRSAPGDCYRT